MQASVYRQPNVLKVDEARVLTGFTDTREKWNHSVYRLMVLHTLYTLLIFVTIMKLLILDPWYGDVNVADLSN